MTIILPFTFFGKTELSKGITLTSSRDKLYRLITEIVDSFLATAIAIFYVLITSLTSYGEIAFYYLTGDLFMFSNMAANFCIYLNFGSILTLVSSCSFKVF